MTAIIEVRDLRKNFGNLQAVKGISFSVETGRTFGFLGPNGAGKSTSIKMLTTLLAPTSGTISIDGEDPGVNPHAVRRSLGIVFQDPSLDDDLSASENLEMHGILYGVPRRERRERIADLLEFVDLSDRRNDFVRYFSGGMKRRLEIARALLHRPKILFLDEPTLGLDPQTRNLMWGYLATLKRDRGMTVFFTTHYMEEAERNADTIAVIDHGAIIASGTPDDLKQRTQKSSLEDAFLSLIGRNIREESASGNERMRMLGRASGR